MAVRDRMHFQGEAYRKRYGEQVRQMPPVRRMRDLKVPVGLGTDGTRVSGYDHWPSLYWTLLAFLLRSRSRLARHGAGA